MKIGAARYYLQAAIEVCIDLGNHLIASERWRAPKDRDVFSVLQENGVVTEDFARTLRQMAGVRNLLVHLYWEVDAEMIYGILQERLGAFERYRGCILAVLRQSGRDRNHGDKR